MGATLQHIRPIRTPVRTLQTHHRIPGIPMPCDPIFAPVANHPHSVVPETRSGSLCCVRRTQQNPAAATQHFNNSFRGIKVAVMRLVRALLRVQIPRGKSGSLTMAPPSRPVVTRFAPSPTGVSHFRLALNESSSFNAATDRIALCRLQLPWGLTSTTAVLPLVQDTCTSAGRALPSSAIFSRATTAARSCPCQKTCSLAKHGTSGAL